MICSKAVRLYRTKRNLSALLSLWVFSVTRKPAASGHHPRLTRDEYEECFRRALRRMAVALNSRHRLCPRRLLKQDDAEIKAYFVRTRDKKIGRPINKSLIRLHHAQEDQNVTDEEALENFFYGHFGDFTPSERLRPIPIDYWYTERFLALSN